MQRKAENQASGEKRDTLRTQRSKTRRTRQRGGQQGREELRIQRFKPPPKKQRVTNAEEKRRTQRFTNQQNPVAHDAAQEAARGEAAK